ncbi:hypothetical protein LX95_01518 [Mesonia algae]|uniref:Uncharacterized protein n=1 Tax=Mesonia algae TaxID=213248 RepID=A0A2W7I5K6_9FLAO|nr:hypothetical protein LX95_01518 [Mesonia algae]
MKKIYVIVVTVFLNITLFSCTPQQMDEQQNPRATKCCDEEGDIPPTVIDSTQQGG